MRMIFGDTVLLRTAKAVARVDHHVERQADRQIAAQRRIQRDQRALHRLFQRGVVGQYPIDNRFAVFAFANLEIGRIAGGLDKITLRINME